jgi:hypothetical protein
MRTVCLLVAAVALVGCKKGDDAATAAAASSAASVAPKPVASQSGSVATIASKPASPSAAPGPVGPTDALTTRVALVTSLAEVIPIVRPQMSAGADGYGDGAAVLVAWLGIHKATVESIEAIPDDTDYGMVMKDASAELGKRYCVTGKVITIEVMPGEPKAYSGLLADGDHGVRFVAARSTGRIVADSTARYCGIVTGSTSRKGADGKTYRSADTVGLFDLPENRAAASGAPPSPPANVGAAPASPRGTAPPAAAAEVAAPVATTATPPGATTAARGPKPPQETPYE